ncbi:MAG: hypothetical protein ACP5XB_07970 [Isosphaeraceae bacterium]
MGSRSRLETRPHARHRARLGELVASLPTWPWCRDEDTFATLAQSWDAGIRPYRDIRAYNFPGHIYLHWLLGRTLGWGRTQAFYALDVAALLVLGAALWAWSRRRLQGTLSGLLAYVAFLSFYLSLSYHEVAERDWHATLAAALAIMTLESWPARWAIWTASALEALALVIRPHAILFVPAILSAIAERPRGVRAAIEWVTGLVLFTTLGFAPLLVQGILDDLARGLGVAAYGGPYSHASLALAIEIITHELSHRVLIVVLASLLLLWRFDTELRPLARTWFLALVAGIVYRTVHPVQHAYLANPLALVSAIALAVPTARLVSISRLAPPVRVLVLLLVVHEVMPHVPSFCEPIESIRALKWLGRGVEPPDPPPGCRRLYFRLNFCCYPWADYRRALDYLRRTTSPDTEIANVLKQPPFPSFNGPVGRLSPFRTESGICWMLLIDMDLDAEFARELERSTNSVVVWSPGEIGLKSPLKLKRLTSLIAELYRPEARFGRIEIWKRTSEFYPPPK